MFKQKKVLLSVLIMCSLLIVNLQISWAGPAEEAAQMADKWFKAFYDGDAEAMSSLYAKDASFFGFLGPFRVEGREGIRASFAGLFKSFPTRALVKRHFYVQIYDTTVVRTYYFTMTLGDAKGNIKSYHGRADIVYMIVDGQRVIVTHHSALLPN
ncbi:MAG: SgcJ/EcaC family oxidoreductase [Deltaproteobacteria bacterium]|nr:SgcJ/EcaC family oxidoreductase [Deltaproteobacteria bacterium]